jgi:predicted RNase H-like HicB family nuclease
MDLSKKTSDWRLGRENYALKCDYVLATGKTPEQLLAEAEAALKTTRDELDRLAKPKTAKQALDDIAKQHATPETYMAEAKQALVQATMFVKEKGLLTLPPRSNLDVIDTPEFLRGIYRLRGQRCAPLGSSSARFG